MFFCKLFFKTKYQQAAKDYLKAFSYWTKLVGSTTCGGSNKSLLKLYHCQIEKKL